MLIRHLISRALRAFKICKIIINYLGIYLSVYVKPGFHIPPTILAVITEEKIISDRQTILLMSDRLINNNRTRRLSASYGNQAYVETN